MFKNNSSSSKTEHDKTDSWSFAFDYQHFSNKNKPKSLLGRRTTIKVLSQQNENRCDGVVNSFNKADRTPLKAQHFNGPSLTHPINPNVTPIDKLSQATLNSELFSSRSKTLSNENEVKNCQKELNFFSPFKLIDCAPKQEINYSKDCFKVDDENEKYSLNREREVCSLSVSDSANMLNKDLNSSFICEDAYPLFSDSSISNETNQRIKAPITNRTADSSHTENGNNSCFMTAHEIHPPDLSSFKYNEFNFKTPRRVQDSFSSKTPGRNFTLFSVSQSPIDPLAGILNEENETFDTDNVASSRSNSKNEELCSKLSTDDIQHQTVNNHSSQSVHPTKLENHKSEIVPDKSKQSSWTEKEIQTPLQRNIKVQSEIIEKHTSPQKNYSNQEQISNHETPVIKSLDLQLSAKKAKNVSKAVLYQKYANSTPSSSFKETPTVIVSGKQQFRQNSKPRPVNNVHLNQVPVEGFVGPRIINAQPQNILYVNNKPYAALSLLGRGGSSEVYQVLEENSSRLLAIKCVNLSSVEESTANGYLNEIDLLSKLQCCPSVIKMLDHEYVESSKMLYVVMEKGDIDLSKLLKDTTKIKEVPMSMILYYWSEMLAAVKDIHDKGVIHSDLKPSNFLLVCGRLKLIDFGIASSIQGDMTSVEKDVIRGTFNYISPEAICAGENRLHKINYKSDVWSLGCILYNLLFGYTPFSHLTSTLGKFQAIADPNYKIKFPKDCSHVPPALLLSVRWCLIKDPKSRPQVDRLLKLSHLALRVPQIDKIWYQYVIQEFPDCPVGLEDFPE